MWSRPGFPAQTERFPLHPIPTTYKTRMCENWKREVVLCLTLFFLIHAGLAAVAVQHVHGVPFSHRESVLSARNAPSHTEPTSSIKLNYDKPKL